MPVVRRHRVDLVLQGHDHVYGRRTAGEDGAPPVLTVSVAGPKQYRLSPRARASMAPVAEDTQLFQVLRIDPTRLRYEARTATGRLYDAFELVRDGATTRLRTTCRSSWRPAPPTAASSRVPSRGTRAPRTPTRSRRRTGQRR